MTQDKSIKLKTKRQIKITDFKKPKNTFLQENNFKDKAKIIEVKSLNLFYGKKQVLFDLNFDVFEKHVLAFIGPSGCGKSTLLRVFNRMNDMIDRTKTLGEVFVNGKNIYRSNNDIVKLRTNVGMVFQKPTPFPMSIYDNVAFGLRHRGIKNKKQLDMMIKDALKKAALWDEVKDFLSSSALGLSGGQQQRLCIARAIATKPKIILMDEPTSALDPISTHNIEELVRSLKKYFTIIIVTHQLAQAARLSDFVCFFREGRLVEYGPTKQIFSQPKEKDTLNYITRRVF